MTAGMVVRSLVAGASGVAAMTLAEKIEQAFTRRPNSFVPGHTMERLAGASDRPDTERPGTNHVRPNWAMHWGQGIVLGAARGLMAQHGIRGPIASLILLNVRLTADQTLENATGVGTPPWTWPRDEQWIDLMHKGVYAFTAGAVADSLIAGPTSSATVARVGWRPGHTP